MTNRRLEDVSVQVLSAGFVRGGLWCAGLTLTAARHVVLLEPFMKTGEEAQALNRCHRIGRYPMSE